MPSTTISLPRDVVEAIDARRASKTISRGRESVQSRADVISEALVALDWQRAQRPAPKEGRTLASELEALKLLGADFCTQGQECAGRWHGYRVLSQERRLFYIQRAPGEEWEEVHVPDRPLELGTPRCDRHLNLMQLLIADG